MTQPAQLDAPLFLTDGGAETTLIFDDGIDLPDFAAFPLLDDPDGHAALTRYFERYAGIAERDGVGVVLETATLARQSRLGRTTRLTTTNGSKQPTARPSTSFWTCGSGSRSRSSSAVASGHVATPTGLSRS